MGGGRKLGEGREDRMDLFFVPRSAMTKLLCFIHRLTDGGLFAAMSFLPNKDG